MGMTLREHAYQNWRAVAIDNKGQEHLLCLGHTFNQVRDTYRESFADLLTEGEQQAIQRIVLQRWRGMADRGHWITKNILPLPDPTKRRAS